MPSSPWVMIDLVVFDTPERAKPLLESFYKFSCSNITEPDLEVAGEELPLKLNDGSERPALRGLVWIDSDCEDAIDEWVEKQEAKPAFMVVMGYVDSRRAQAPALVWARTPGKPPCMLGDLEGDDIAELIGVEPRQVVESAPFAATVIGLSLARPEFDGFKAHIDALKLDESTQEPTAASRSFRI